MLFLDLAVNAPLLHALCVAAVVELGAVVLDAEGLVRHAIEEVTVVGDHHDAAVVISKKALQPTQGLDVQVVGRLIQQQHVGLAGELDAQGQAGLLTAAQKLHGHIGKGLVKAKTPQDPHATSAELQSSVADELLVEGGVCAGHAVVFLLA